MIVLAPSQGRSQDLSKGGSQRLLNRDTIWRLPTIYGLYCCSPALMYQQAQSYYHGMKAHINY